MDMIKWRKQMNKKVLNLYSGIGGNRKLWTDVDVTAVEIEPKIARIYQDFFPDDKMVVGDAHQYLLEHYKEFDFIWSSPPCPTHSRMNFLTNITDGKQCKYPDMTLYQEIIYLKYWFKGKWCVENVKSYYEPLIKPFESGNHYFWSNFVITNRKKKERGIRTETIKEKEEKRGFIIPNSYSKTLKEKVLNNCVFPELGKHIFNCAFRFEHKGIENWLGD
jgi:DNA (cytosine-5)-methyltransferase 1